MKIHLLIKLRQRFTRKLTSCINTSMLAFIDRLYSVGYDFSNFRTVLIFATSIKVASYLAYINKLVQGYRYYKVKIRQIVLI